MDFQRVGTRGYLFTFMDPYLTNIYVIDGSKHIFILDTFLGPTPMQMVKKKISKTDISKKPWIAFNSHADYDHYWGNMEFKDGWIIAHDSAYQRIQSQGSQSLIEYGKYKMGEVEITPPNLLFRKKLTFVEDKIEFNYTPGHTGDSASCWDPIDRVLFTGDNIESPIPQVNLLNLKEWQQSLEEYLKIEPKIVICGHSTILEGTGLIQETLMYLKGLQSLQVNLDNWTERHHFVHTQNLRHIAGLYLGRGDKGKAIDYYREVIKVLNESEKTQENENRKKSILETILKISG